MQANGLSLVISSRFLCSSSRGPRVGARMRGGRRRALYAEELAIIEEIRLKSLLQDLAAALPPAARTLELGASTAFAAVRLARALMPSHGVVYTADPDPEWVAYLR